MSFALSGTTITQTGTDTDLSGLAAIAGVTTQVVTSKTFYFFSLKLNIAGTLTFDPDTEALLVDENAPVRPVEVLDGGILNLGAATTLNGYTRYSQELAIYIGVITAASLAFKEDDAGGLYIADGGTFNWNGGIVNVASPTGFKDEATVVIRNGILDSSRNQLAQLRYFADLDMITFQVLGGTAVFSDQDIINFSGYEPIQMAAPLVGGGNRSGENIYFDVRDYAGQGCTQDVTFLNVNIRGTRMFNPNVGSNLTIAGHELQTGSNRDGTCEIFSEFQITTIDADSVAIGGTKLFIEDKDNGERQDRTQGTSEDYTTDRDILETLDGNGQAIISKLIATKISNNNPTKPIDRRTATNDGSDIDILHLFKYGYAPAQPTIGLSGNGVKELDWTLISNSLITEADKAVVQAYTEISTAQQFYDSSECYVEDNWGTLLETLITREGSIIDAGSYDVDVDDQATDVFTFDGSKITIKATEFTDSIRTTGTVSILNDAIVSGTITDGAGTKFKLTSSQGILLSSYVTLTLADTTSVDLGWTPMAASRDIVVPVGASANIFVSAHGYDPEVYYGVSAAAGFTISLNANRFIDTSVDQTILDEIAVLFRAYVSGTDLIMETSGDLSAYSANEVISALSYDLSLTSADVAAATLSAWHH